MIHLNDLVSTPRVYLGLKGRAAQIGILINSHVHDFGKNMGTLFRDFWYNYGSQFSINTGLNIKVEFRNLPRNFLYHDSGKSPREGYH